jgi:hypothetical protein
MVMLMRKNDRGQYERAQFTGYRQSEDMPAKEGAEITAFAENGKQHAEGGRRQHKGYEQGRVQQADRIKQSGEQRLKQKAASHAVTPSRSGPAPISSGLNSNPAWKSRNIRPNSPRNPMAPWLVTRPSTLGPIKMPSKSSNTTAGMRANAGKRVSKGAKTATKAMIKRA